MSKKVVFDTNILISGYLWRGAPRRALDRARSRQWTLLSSRDTIEEFIRVLAYEKFGLNPAEIAPIAEDLQQISEFVPSRSKVQVIQADPTDDIFLNLALDGQATLIVSGDRHLLNLKTWRGIAILSVSTALRED